MSAPEPTPGPTPPRRAPSPASTGTLGARLLDPSGLDGALLRYRALAYVVGVGLASLVFVGIPLQLAGHPGFVTVVGAVHGLFYVAYLAFALDLARRARFSGLEMLAMVGAGLVPILAFVIERRVTRRVRTEILPRWSLPRSRRPAQPEAPHSSSGSAAE